MFLNNLVKKILGFNCFMSAVLCVASEQSLSVMRHDGLIAECSKQHESPRGITQEVYAVIVQYPGQLVTKRLFVRSIQSMQFKGENLELVFKDGRKDYIPVN